MIRDFRGEDLDWRRNNGLNATKMARMRICYRKRKTGIGSSMRYNYRDADVVTVGSSQRFLQSGEFLFQFKQSQ